jgi:hypothetical protein
MSDNWELEIASTKGLVAKMNISARTACIYITNACKAYGKKKRAKVTVGQVLRANNLHPDLDKNHNFQKS